MFTTQRIALHIVLYCTVFYDNHDLGLINTLL